MPDNTNGTSQNEPTQAAAQQPAQSQPPADPGEPHGDSDAAIDWKEFPADWDEQTILKACAQAVQMPEVTAAINDPEERSKDVSITVGGVSLPVRVSWAGKVGKRHITSFFPVDSSWKERS